MSATFTWILVELSTYLDLPISLSLYLSTDAAHALGIMMPPHADEFIRTHIHEVARPRP